MDAIVYTTNTGFTEEYAKLLSSAAGIPAYSLKASLKALEPGKDIIYMGWLMASMVKGYKKAAKCFNVKAVCAVGMSPDNSQQDDIIKANNLQPNNNLFLLQGGFKLEKLHGIYKLMMKLMAKSIIKKAADKQNTTPEQLDMLDLFQNGGSRVSLEKLEPVVNWLKDNK